jgi:chloramphenicol 3-O-phosphotransferase
MAKENAPATLGRITILSGAVGCGKTTVAKCLLPLLPEPACYIEGDIFWSFIARPGQRRRRDNFRVIMRAMTAACIPFARSGFSVLLDFAIPPDFVPMARVILKEVPFDYVVLHPDLAECARRAAERAEGQITDYAPFESFHALFNRTEGALDNGDVTPEETAGRIGAGLAAGVFAIQGGDRPN